MFLTAYPQAATQEQAPTTTHHHGDHQFSLLNKTGAVLIKKSKNKVPIGTKIGDTGITHVPH